MLSRDQILQSDDLPRKEVLVPEWGGSVFVRTMSGSERDRFEAAHLRNPEKNFRARLAVLTVCDDKGSPLFNDADIETLGAKSSSALTRIFEAASKLNRLSKEDYEDLGNGSAGIPSVSSP